MKRCMTISMAQILLVGAMACLFAVGAGGTPARKRQPPIRPFSSIECMAFSPDGKLLVTGESRRGSADFTCVRFYDVKTATEVKRLPVCLVSSLAFFEDGKRLASEGAAFRMWDIEKMELLTAAVPKPPIETASYCVALSPDQRTLATASGGGVVSLWSMPDGKSLARLKGHKDEARCVAISSDGKYMASGGGEWDKKVVIWDFKTRQILFVLEGHSRDVLFVTFSPDGKLLASAGKDATVRIWNVERGKAIHTLRPSGHPDSGAAWVSGISWSPDGKTLASGGGEGVRLWNPKSGRSEKVLGNPGAIPAFSPDGKTLACGGYYQIHFWDYREGKIVKTIERPTPPASRPWEIDEKTKSPPSTPPDKPAARETASAGNEGAVRGGLPMSSSLTMLPRYASLLMERAWRWERDRLGAQIRFIGRFCRSPGTIQHFVVARIALRARQAWEQRQIVRQVRAAGGQVAYDYHRVETPTNSYEIPNAKPPGPEWLRAIVGDDFFTDVTSVGVGRKGLGQTKVRRLCRLSQLRVLVLDTAGIADEDMKFLPSLVRLKSLHIAKTPMGDKGIAYLAGMSQLGWLNLEGTQITDAGLMALSGMPNLQWLSLVDTRITDNGLERLLAKNALSKLRTLNVSGTKISVDKLRAVKRALPGCSIVKADGQFLQ